MVFERLLGKPAWVREHVVGDVFLAGLGHEPGIGIPDMALIVAPSRSGRAMPVTMIALRVSRLPGSRLLLMAEKFRAIM
ncbi:MAG: hypothetical protein JNL16_14040 [Dechloromonas sp.]|nr:hypothetical protein [Dechloromonas sp.]